MEALQRRCEEKEKLIPGLTESQREQLTLQLQQVSRLSCTELRVASFTLTPLHVCSMSLNYVQATGDADRKKCV